jgi:hypothetical protein
MNSDHSETAFSSETADRRMSNDMFEPLSDKPNGTTTHTQLTNTCLPGGERPNKTTIFISDDSDARASWLGCGHVGLV